MEILSTNIFMANASGETIINDFPDGSCLYCFNESCHDRQKTIICPLCSLKKHVIHYQDELGTLEICDAKEKTTKNFITLAELIKHVRPFLLKRFSSLADGIKRSANKDLETFKHNIIHINSDAINEFYSFITQDSLVKNYRKLYEFVYSATKSNPNDAAELITRLVKYNLNIKTELSVISKLNNPDSQPSYSMGNPRDAIMTSVYTLYPLFRKNSIYVNVGEYWEKINIDYDALQVASFYIIQNAAKYCEKKSKVDIEFERLPHSLNISFSMRSLYIAEDEESKIFLEGFQGSQARLSKRGGKGLGMYRAKRLVDFFNGALTLEAGGECIKGTDGYKYSNNKFIIEIPVSMTI